MRRMRNVTIIAILFVLCLALQGGACADGTTTRLETRDTLEGKVVLSHEVGLNDMSRVKVDIGQGEGGVAPEEDGSFIFRDLEADLYDLVITYAGGLGADAQGSGYQRYEQTVSATQGSVTNLGLIELRPGLGKVSGKITLAPDVDGAQVTVKLNGATYLETNPDDEGDYSFAEVPVGTYGLSVSGEGLRSDVCAGPQVLVGWHGHEVTGPRFSLNTLAVDVKPVGDQVFVNGNEWYLSETTVDVLATDSPVFTDR